MPNAFPRRRRLALGATLAALVQAGPAAIAHGALGVVVPAAGGEPWTAEDVTRLGVDLDRLLTTSVTLRGAHAGVLALDSTTGKILYAHNADDAFAPASTLKLLVGSAALERLGPAFRFHTQLEASASAPNTLVLRAGGDPFLAHTDFDDAAAAVAAAGISAVRDIVIDDSHDDREPYAPGWTWDDFAYDYAAHVSAMTLDENVVHLRVMPGSSAGSAAVVRAESPSLPGGEFTSRAQTGDAGTQSTLDVRVGGTACLDVFGSVPLGGDAESLDGAVCDPLAFGRGALMRSLRARGIAATDPAAAPAAISAVTPPAIPAVTPTTIVPGRTIWQHDSAALATWLGPRFWIPSDNLVAELLLKELGFVTAGAPGTDDTGTAFETAWLRSIGVDPATVSLADGSGLSQYDRITPRDLVAILQHDWNGPNRKRVLDSLPIGGVRGTIEGIAGSAAAGRVFAKTGSMMHVRGLAGFLATRRHGAVTFAFSVDDWLGEYPALAKLRAQVLARIVTD